MKKRRGLRRYYRKLRQLNEFASAVSWLEDIHDPDSWFYYAHIHFDWSGYGDTRWNYTEICTFKTKNLIGYLGKLKAQGYSVLYAPAGSRYSDCIVFQESLEDNKQLQEENI